jgi:hypothetical protein
VVALHSDKTVFGMTRDWLVRDCMFSRDVNNRPHTTGTIDGIFNRYNYNYNYNNNNNY